MYPFPARFKLEKAYLTAEGAARASAHPGEGEWRNNHQHIWLNTFLLLDISINGRASAFGAD